MRVELRQPLQLPDIGWVDAGVVEIPDGLAAALCYQGLAKLLDAPMPDEIKALVVPARKGRPKK